MGLRTVLSSFGQLGFRTAPPRSRGPRALLAGARKGGASVLALAALSIAVPLLTPGFLNFALAEPSADAAKSGGETGDGGSEIFKVGQQAPAFELTDLKGAKVSLESLKGKRVLLNFWATWCVPCVTEMPSLERLEKLLSKEGLMIVAVNVDSPDKNADVAKFVAENGITFQILRDPDFAVPQQYGLTGFPESFFLGPNGEFLDFKDPVSKSHGVRVVGDRPWDSPAMVQAVRELLTQAKPTKP